MPTPDAPEPFPSPAHWRRPDGLLPADRCLHSYLDELRRDAINAAGFLELAEQHDADPERRTRYRDEALAYARHIIVQLADVIPGTCG